MTTDRFYIRAAEREAAAERETAESDARRRRSFQMVFWLTLLATALLCMGLALTILSYAAYGWEDLRALGYLVDGFSGAYLLALGFGVWCAE